MRPFLPPLIVVTIAVAGAAGSSSVHAAPALPDQFQATVRPFLDRYCLSCHAGDKPKAELDLSRYSTFEAVVADQARWAQVAERLVEKDMPPEKAERRPAESERRAVVRWIEAMRRAEGQKHAGDPGPVLARRLSNAEYDYTIRDLTGVDIRPTREFPVDPANEAGFDNSGESLGMSPALVKKYLEAARQVADFLVMTPHGLEFAPHPVVADTDRDRYGVNRIMAFYGRQETDLARYFEAAWLWKHRSVLGRGKGTLAAVAAERAVSAKYLQTVYEALEHRSVGPLAKLQAMWRRLPAPKGQARPPVAACEQMRDFVVGLRKQLVPEVANLTGGKMNNGSQPMLMWKNRQWAANRRRCDPTAIERGPDPDLVLPIDSQQRVRHQEAFQQFCSIFPDAFVVSERGRTYADQEREKQKGRGGRLLNAGFHSMTGYFRDDGPLYELMLDDGQRRELDRLWDDFFFFSSLAIRMHTSFLWFERSDSSFMMSPEFNFTRPEDKSCTDEPVLWRLTEAILAKARANGGSETVLQAIRDHFDTVNRNVRWLEKARQESEPAHLAALQELAARAFRRPLGADQRAEMVRFYQSLRAQNGLTHEESIRNSLVRVLMSPHFLYRAEPVAVGGVRPLSDTALASRLSYFLWASLPDRQLLDLAAAGRLRRPEVLLAQTRRMLKDPRARGLATEFAANWLDFRRFEQHNGVDRQRFPTFDNELRQAMFDEPIRFTMDVVQRDRSVLEFLHGKHTFVNPALARHYGMPAVEGAADHWVRVDRAGQYGRGGLLPMAVFLTANSPGLRTSPVKRGYWVVRRLLGEHIPPPPANVAELPSDEAKSELSLRQVLERHRADEACAGCHARFDAFGLVFEGYGPVGERRAQDFGGRPVEIQAVFPDGTETAGLEGLQRYLRQRRQGDFVDNLCRKLLAYSLGRSLILSDETTVEQMKRALAARGHRFGALVETIVQSPQFLNKRGASPLAQRADSPPASN